MFFVFETDMNIKSLLFKYKFSVYNVSVTMLQFA